MPSGPSSGSGNTSVTDNGSWDYSWGGEHLYLSGDNRPILFTIGTRIYYTDKTKSKDYIAFYDVAKGAQLKLVPMPGASLMTHEHGNTDISYSQFSNGDMYIIADHSVISRIKKGSLTLEDVTQSLFEDQRELASGIAKVDFANDRNNNNSEELNLFTNDGKNYFYFPLLKKLYTKETVPETLSPIKTPSIGNVLKTGFDFSNQADYDHTEIGATLVAYQYMGKKDALAIPIPRYTPFYWTDEKSLKEKGVLSHKDFTPGRNYFEQGLLYFDDDYVLICYKQTPAGSAVRYLQCLNAHTGAIVFTTRLDTMYPPDQCVRYSGGFAMLNNAEVYNVTLSGKITKYIPDMYNNYNK